MAVDYKRVKHHADSAVLKQKNVHMAKRFIPLSQIPFEGHENTILTFWQFFVFATLK